jgi:peptide/nickel transport system substrate-binding protein
VEFRQKTGRPLRFTVLFPDDAVYAGLGQLLVREYDAAGIGVGLEVLPSTEIRSRVERGEYEAAVLPLFAGGYPDEDFGLIYGKGTAVDVGTPTANLARFRDPVIDEAVELSRATGDISKQADQYQAVQEKLARESPYVFLVHLQGSIVAGPAVQGLTAWTLPNGAPGISQLRTTVSLGQAWVARPGGTTASGPTGSGMTGPGTTR